MGVSRVTSQASALAVHRFTRYNLVTTIGFRDESLAYQIICEIIWQLNMVILYSLTDIYLIDSAVFAVQRNIPDALAHLYSV